MNFLCQQEKKRERLRPIQIEKNREFIFEKRAYSRFLPKSSVPGERGPTAASAAAVWGVTTTVGAAAAVDVGALADIVFFDVTVVVVTVMTQDK